MLNLKSCRVINKINIKKVDVKPLNKQKNLTVQNTLPHYVKCDSYQYLVNTVQFFTAQYISINALYDFDGTSDIHKAQTWIYV